MKKHLVPLCLVFALLLIAIPASAQSDTPQTPVGDYFRTQFTYQGKIKDTAGNPITGTCDFSFGLWNSLVDGTQVGSVSVVNGAAVDNGYFTVLVNAASEFGANAFVGAPRWLEIGVRCPSGNGEYTTLSPRQALTVTPLASFAFSSSWADTTPWTGISGLPLGFADGVDNDTTYTAGTGLNLAGAQFSIDTSYRLPQSCSNGQYPSWNFLTSRWGCGTDANTTYTAGSGLALTGNEFSVIGAPWSGLTSVPVGFADGTDDTGSDWHITGNSGTNPSTNFLGTTDNQMLAFKVNGLMAFRLEPNVNAPNIIGGRSNNSVTDGVYGAAISGGGATANPNQVTANFGTIGGGYSNTAGGNLSTISGGTANTTGAYGAVVSGGCGNTASAAGSVVAGGGCFDGGYTGNEATGIGATVSGGIANQSDGYASAVGGGKSNWVNGDYSFAIGYRAKNTNASHDGVFIFADSNAFDFYSTAANQFRVRSTGGVQFVTGIDGSGAANAGVQVAAGGGSWSSISDRNLKANFAAVNGRAILDAVTAMPIQTWNYIAQDESIRHIGPMAQDFYTAFGLGEDNTHIATIDADGVALAAIQGLNEIVAEKDVRIAAIEAELAELKQQTQNSAAPSPLATPWPWLAVTILGLTALSRRPKSSQL
jgi:hypothetical protein